MKLMKAILGLLLVFCSAVVFAQAIDINTATVEQLEGLKGIGPKKAAAIVKYREANGPFGSIDDLAKVPGIGKKTLTANEAMLQVGETTTSTVPAVPKTPEMPSMPKTSTTSTMPAVPKTPEMPVVPKTSTTSTTSTMPSMPKASDTTTSTMPPMPKASATTTSTMPPPVPKTSTTPVEAVKQQ